MSDGPPLRTRFHRQETSPGLLLWQVTNRWQAAQRATLAPFHLTHVQFVLLACLTWLQDRDPPGPITQRKLAEFAATDPMMTSQVLRRLSAAGLVTRTTHPRDTRAKAIAVTGAGRARVNEAIGAVEACDDRFFAPLGADRAAFTASLAGLGLR